MDLNKFTQKAQEAIFQSQQIAKDNHHQAIEPVHIMLALIHQPEGVVPAVINKIAGNSNALLDEVKKEIDIRPKVTGWSGEVSLSSQASQVLDAAERFARGMQD
jgi:ATP-dependent Clp protease ATP-binding subunit ClpB